jgi:hypothetical protein
MDALLKFIASRNGRIARVVVGIVLIIIGLVIGGILGAIIVVIGVIPVVAGALDVCLVAPLLGKPLKGADLRASLESSEGKK